MVRLLYPGHAIAIIGSLLHLIRIAGEPIVEPEVDLSSFLERQRISDAAGPSMPPPPDSDDEVDETTTKFKTMFAALDVQT